MISGVVRRGHQEAAAKKSGRGAERSTWRQKERRDNLFRGVWKM